MKKHAKHRQLVKSNQAQPPVATFNKKAILFYVSMMFASNTAHANPTGGEFAAGAGAISTLGNLTTVQQNTQRAIVNWQSFGTNAGEAVKFVQPSANAAILNRVVGNLPSNLNGLLEGNGRVYLINPNGIVLGQNGVINVNGGFVASTQNISDSAFMQGGALLFTGENTGNIQILGKIQSAQGDIVIIAPKTEIAAGAELKAGQSIQLIAANEVRLSNGKFTVTPKLGDAGQLTVAGTLEAAKVQLEAHNNNLGALAINTTGTIRANGTQTNPDGSVTIMAYGEGSNIKVNGNISAQNNDASQQGGRIIVGRNEETGELAKSADVSGARFTTNKGFVETSGDYLVTTGTRVLAKDWLLDPFNITIVTGNASSPIPNYSNYTAGSTSTSTILASDIVANLANTNVKISTGVGTSSSGTQDGNIVVNADIIYGGSTGRTLTLEANNGITLNKAIKSTSGKLDVTLTANGNASNTANSYGVYMDGGSSIDANGGAVTLDGTSKFPTGGYNKGGLYMFMGTSIKGGSVTIDAKNLGTTGGIAYGAFFDHKTTITATAGDINVTGKLTGAAAGKAIFSGSNPGGGVGLTWSATGKVSITGDLTGSTNASTTALSLGSLRINAGGDVNIIAKTPNAGAGAIVMQYEGTGWNPAIKAGGNISILANQGSIALNNFDAANTTAGLGITGKNITINNTLGQLVNGSYDNKGQSTSASWSGVQLNGVAGSVVATGDVKIFGNSQSDVANPGVNISAGVKGASVTIDGASKTGNGVYSAQNIESTNGDVNITATSETNYAASLQGVITASNNVIIKGINSSTGNASAAVYLNKAVNATNGKIDITASTSGTSANALQIVSGGKLTAGTNINLQADSMSLGDTITAKNGAGTVNIKTDSAATKIDIGSGTGTSGVDVGGASRTLGLSKAELDRISAGKTVIGDAANIGGITVSAATTTLSQTGDITLQTGGNILVDKALTIDNSKTLTLNAGGTITDNDTTGVIKASKLELLGSNAAVTLDSKLHEVGTLAADVKSLNFANKTALTVGAVNSTTGINAKEGVSVTTQTGNLNLNEAISNSTSGDVVVGAGVADAAGVTTGGDVKTTDGKTIANNGTGKTYIYSGKASTTGTLSYLDSSLTDLYLDGTTTGKAQNADSGVAYGAKITNGANTQVLFREKVNVSLQDYVSGATLNKIYGDPNTANGQSTALWTDMQGALKASNSSNGSSNQLTSTMQDGNGQNITFHVSAATVIDDMTGTMQLPGSDYSTANYLKANNTANNNPNGYSYNVPTSTGKYTFAFDLNNSAVKVVVDKLALTGSIATGHTTYGSQLEAGAVTLTNVQGSGLSADKVSAAGVSIDTTGKTSTSGNLKAGTHKDIQSVAGITGADADNYTFANVKGDYTVNQKAITTADIAAVTDAVYGTSKATGAVSLGDDVILGDKVAAANLATVKDGEKSGSGNLNAGSYKQTVDGGLTGASGADDSANYTFAGVTTNSKNYNVAQKDITVTAKGNSVNYNGKPQTDTVTNSGLVAGDNADIVGAGSGTAEGVYQSKLRLVGNNAGDDTGNYNVTFENAPFTIKVNTPSAYRYTPSSADAVTLTPITFGFGVAGGATAAGGNVEGSCDAWSQRAGAGSVSVMSLLKPNYMGLRNAKTDNMDAMSGGQASGASVSEEANPCANAAQVERQAKL